MTKNTSKASGIFQLPTEEEVSREVDSYESLSFWKKSKTKALYTFCAVFLFGLVVSLFLGIIDASDIIISFIIYGFFWFFIWRGSQSFIIITLCAYTFDRVYTMLTYGDVNFISVTVGFFFWIIVVKPLYTTYLVEPRVKAKRKHCAHCGKKLDTKSTFCEHCGTKISK